MKNSYYNLTGFDGTRLPVRSQRGSVPTTRDLQDGPFKDKLDIPSRLDILANDIDTVEQCQEILDTYVFLQSTVRNAVERKLRKLQKADKSMKFEEIPKAEKLTLLIEKLEALFQYDGTCVIIAYYEEVVDSWYEAHDALKAFKKVVDK